ncbi:MAG: SH3 domain-containing protein [Saprospiraceae bacterium]|nr:SH3 domain-containing protein [Saprospiraceae bacterium]
MNHIKYIWFSFFLCLLGTTDAQSEFQFSADSLFNLGNKAYASEEYDQAIYFYEKARLLEPNSKDIAINLQLASENLTTDIIRIEPFFLSSWWSTLSNMMLPGSWKMVSLVLMISLLTLVYFYSFKKMAISRNTFYGLVATLLVCVILSILAGNSRYNRIFNSPIAIVFGDEQSLYMGPDQVSEKIKVITGGDRLRILDEVDSWYKVSAMDSEQGWILKSNVKQIKF